MQEQDPFDDKEESHLKYINEMYEAAEKVVVIENCLVPKEKKSKDTMYITVQSNIITHCV